MKERFLLAGQVKNSVDVPVEKATVSFGSDARGAQYRFALTDADGFYTIHVPDDVRITLSATKHGWKSATRSFQVSAVVPVRDFTLRK